MKTFFSFMLLVIVIAANINEIHSQPQMQWERRYNGTESMNTTKTTLTDDSGNTYVVANIDIWGVDTVFGISILKYSSNGFIDWYRKFVSDGCTTRINSAILDSYGNIVITGYINSSGSDDFITAKYSTTGIFLWETRYHTNGEDRAERIAADTSGNVYITGRSINPSAGYDFATIKYNSSGEQQWLMRYNSGGIVSDIPADIVFSKRGYIYVGGTSGNNFTTIQYSLSGAQQWVSSYLTSGTASAVKDLDVDSKGYVIIAGQSYLGSSLKNDIITVKYHSNGSQLWSVRASTQRNEIVPYICLDGNNNIYLAGSFENASRKFDYGIIKYNSSGVMQWSRLYSGESAGDNTPRDIACDPSGNVYVGGTSPGAMTDNDYAVVKYNTGGALQWSARYNLPDSLSDDCSSISLDASGNLSVTGTGTRQNGSTDIVTVRYNSSGSWLWDDRFNNMIEGNEAKVIKTDKDGNVYAGSCSKGDYDDVILTIKYDNNGNVLWIRKHSVPGLAFMRWGEKQFMELDSAGNIYIAATGFAGNSNCEVVLIKYNPSGQKQWSVRYKEQLGMFSKGYGMKVDAQGNCYIINRTVISAGVHRMITMKYSSSGTLLVKKTYDASAKPYDIITDHEGNMYVIGNKVDGSPSGVNTGGWYFVKYNPTGVLLWEKYNPIGMISTLNQDRNGNIYTFGTMNSGGLNKASIDKYGSSGNIIWSVLYNDTNVNYIDPNYQDCISSVIDSGSSVIFSGILGHTFISRKMLSVVKLDSAGNLIWTRKRSTYSSLYSKGLIIDNEGSVYTGVTYSYGQQPHDTGWTITKYSNSGTFLWQLQQNSLRRDNDELSSFTLDNNKNIFITSKVMSPASTFFLTLDIVTAKYSQLSGRPIGEFENHALPEKFSLENNYPNPFNPKTIIKYSVGNESKVTLAVYDILGREVGILINNELKSVGGYNIEFDGGNLASGVYFYKLTAGSFTDVKKMVLVK